MKRQLLWLLLPMLAITTDATAWRPWQFTAQGLSLQRTYCTRVNAQSWSLQFHREQLVDIRRKSQPYLLAHGGLQVAQQDLYATATGWWGPACQRVGAMRVYGLLGAQIRAGLTPVDGHVALLPQLGLRPVWLTNDIFQPMFMLTYAPGGFSGNAETSFRSSEEIGVQFGLAIKLEKRPRGTAPRSRPMKLKQKPRSTAGSKFRRRTRMSKVITYF